MIRFTNIPTLLMLLLVAAWADLAAQQADSTPISFKRDIAPILLENCQGCHGPKKSKGDYRVDSFERLMGSGSSNEPAVTPGEPNRSKLYELINAEDELDRMPQKADPLPRDSIERIARWIEQGASYDGSDPQADLASIVPQRPFPEPPRVYPYPMPILALAFHPDGRELAAGGYHEITIWDAEQGTLLRRMTNVTQRVHALAYHPQGDLLAVAGGAPGRHGEAALIDAASGQLDQVLVTTPGVILSIVFSPKGELLAVGGADHAIHLFDVPGKREVRVIRQHADWVTGLAFSPDGQWLASASRDRSARVYDVQTGRLETTYNEHPDAVYDVAFSPDGAHVFSAGADRKIHRWKTKDGKRTRALGGFEEPVLRLLRTRDQLFGSSADRMVKQFDAGNGDPVRTYSGHRDWVHSLAHEPGTGRLAAGGHDGQVCIWDTGTGERLIGFTASPGHWKRAHSARE